MDKEERFARPLALFRDRLALRDIPEGQLSYNTRQWIPSKVHGELQPCCIDLAGRENQGWYMFKHCLSARHVGIKCGLQGEELRDFVDYAECTQFSEYLGKGDTDGLEPFQEQDNA